MAFLTTNLYGNQVWAWLAATGTLLLVWFAARMILRLVARRLRRLSQRTGTRFDDLLVELLAKTRFVFLLVVSVYSAGLWLTLPTTAETVLGYLFVLALLWQAGYWGSACVTFWINRSVQRRLAEDPSSATTLAAFGFIGKVVIWAIVLLLALENLGVDITGLVAGLGISGIAIALAVQNILGDLFASMSIVVDRPFVIGDFIIVGELMGTVEKIGLKTTRVRSLSGEQIVFSNSDLLASRVRNYKRMYERRVVFSVGVTYDTPADTVDRIPAMIESIIEAQPDVRFDRSHFSAFGDSALLFESVYYMLSPDYTVYMDTQHAVNVAIMRAFAENGIEFAYPTQTLYVKQSARARSENEPPRHD